MRSKALDVTRRVAEIVETTEREIQDPHKWSFRSNCNTILFPEGKCYFCKETIKSKAIWLITDVRVLGLYTIVGGKLVYHTPSNSPRHPHTDSRGAICTGDNTSTTGALFFGMNPDGAYDTDDSNNMVAEHLRGWAWEHDCEEMGEYSSNELSYCEECSVEYDPEEQTHETWYCRDCATYYCSWREDEDEHSGRYYCDWCGERSCQEHDHYLEECVDCEVSFDQNVTDMHFCTEQRHSVCPDCYTTHSHDDDEEE